MQVKSNHPYKFNDLDQILIMHRIIKEPIKLMPTPFLQSWYDLNPCTISQNHPFPHEKKKQQQTNDMNISYNGS